MSNAAVKKRLLKVLKFAALSVLALDLLICIGTSLFAKQILYRQLGIVQSDVLYEYNAHNYSDGSFGTGLFIFRKGSETGFAHTEPRNRNFLFPLVPVKIYGYDHSVKYMVDMDEGTLNSLKYDELQNGILLEQYYRYMPEKGVYVAVRYIYTGIADADSEILAEHSPLLFSHPLDDSEPGKVIFLFISDEMLDRKAAKEEFGLVWGII